MSRDDELRSPRSWMRVYNFSLLIANVKWESAVGGRKFCFGAMSLLRNRRVCVLLSFCLSLSLALSVACFSRAACTTRAPMTVGAARIFKRTIEALFIWFYVTIFQDHRARSARFILINTRADAIYFCKIRHSFQQRYFAHRYMIYHVFYTKKYF